MSKKIMFNDKFGLTQAVLKGRKTMTRRIIPDKLLDRWTDYDDFCNSVSVENTPTTRQYYDEKEFFLDNAPYKVGEIIAIAQSYKDCGRFDVYKAPLGLPGWSNKMFVRAYLMPHHIEITDIKIERLQDISEEDCLKEGVELNSRQYEYDGTKLYCVRGLGHWRAIGCTDFDTPREAFIALIDKVSGKGTWESNPYVFVYEFELVD